MATAPRITEVQFRVAVAVVAGLVAVGMIRIRFCNEPTLPKKIARPEERQVAPRELTESIDATPRLYQQYLQRDSELYGVRPAATIESMSGALEHRVDTRRRVLVPDGDAVQVEGLRLSAATRRIEGQVRPIMVLAIENTTDRDLAYHIVTRPSRGTRVCARMPALPHNAMAVAAHRTETRSECIYKPGWKLEVERVEVAVLRPLSYYYVSRIPPDVAGIDPRPAQGHKVPQGRACGVMLPATARNALASGTLQWFDIIDFFARHRCDTYQFPRSYRALGETEERQLPVIAE